MITIVVIAILAVLLLPAISSLRSRAQRVQCTTNLKSLYIAAEGYLQQNGHWPQIRIGDSDTAEEEYARNWIAALKPFGISEKNWICPTIQTLLHNPDYMQPENARVDYIPSAFDDKQITPHRWARQPWFAEIGDVHGNGNLIIFTDGSITDLKTIARAARPASTP
jgi:type II secretory pathway pseudopilin PulG